MKLLSVSSSKSDVIKLFEVKRCHLHLVAGRKKWCIVLFIHQLVKRTAPNCYCDKEEEP